ncbi:MAG: DUF2975 domain-containing protein [Lachnospiraceae bacterium]|nr:DUF2975 domain-containing protein [Lachnospiraceae bacterium]
MDKLKKIANTLDSVAKLIFYINMGAAILMLVVWIIIFGEVLKDQNALREYLILTLGSVKVGIVPEQAPSVTYTNIRFYAGMLMVFILTFFMLYGVKIARKILKPMKEGLPFDESISKNFKHLGVLILIGGGIWSVTKLIIDTTTFNGYHIRELFRPEIVTSVELSASLDTTFLVIAAVFFLLSYIFQYGAELQKLSDETL